MLERAADIFSDVVAIAVIAPLAASSSKLLTRMPLDKCCKVR